MSSYNFYKQKWTEKSFTYIQYRTENSKSIKSTNISSKKVFPSKYSKTLDTKAIKKKTEKLYIIWLTPRSLVTNYVTFPERVLPKTKIPSALPKTLRCSIFLSIQKSHL